MTFLFCLSVYLFVCLSFFSFLFFLFFFFSSSVLYLNVSRFVCLFVRSLTVFHSFALACETEVHGSRSSEIWPGISFPVSCLYEAACVVGSPEPIHKTNRFRKFFLCQPQYTF